MPDFTSICSNGSTISMKSSYSASVQNPMTRSTPARLYQLRFISTISWLDGRWGAKRWSRPCPPHPGLRG